MPGLGLRRAAPCDPTTAGKRHPIVSHETGRVDLLSLSARDTLSARTAVRVGVAAFLVLIAAAAVAGAVLAARTASSTTTPPGPYAGRVGVAVSYDLYASPETQIQTALAQLHAGGVSWIREDLTWAIAEPEPGVFRWASFDRLMKAASLARVHVLGILDYSAPWASSDPSGRRDAFYPPKSNAEFATYAAAVVSRYGHNGSFWSENSHLRPNPLAAVEIWNEPYESWDWKPGPDPGAYAALVSQAAPAMHAVDPQLVVLMSGDLESWDDRLTSHQHSWLASMLAAEPQLAKLVNAIAVHPYPAPLSLGPYYEGPDLKVSFGRVPLIRRAEVAAGVHLPIWITEVGWSTAPNTPQSVSQRTQAHYSLDAIQRSLGQWGSYVSKIFLFGWFRSSGRRGDLAGNYGLLDHDGLPKRAWKAIAHLLGGTPGARDPNVPADT